MKVTSNPSFQKLSLSKLTTNQHKMSITTAPPPSNHIQYQSESFDIFTLESKIIPKVKNMTMTPKRRKIFEKTKQIKNDEVKTAAFITIQQNKITNQKIKNNKEVTFRNKYQNMDNFDQKIAEINRQILQNRRKINKKEEFQTYYFADKALKDVERGLKSMEKSIKQTASQLKCSEQLYLRQIPKLQRMINGNGNEIKEVKQLLKRSLEKNVRKQRRNMEAIQERERSILHKENVITRIQSQLSYCRSENALKSYQAEQHVLEIQRIKRIEGLQMANIQLYSSLQNENPNSKMLTLHDFQDISSEHIQDQNQWIDDDDDIKSSAKNTTIDLEAKSFLRPSNSTFFMEEILSPLTWQENKLFD